jgi:hypothetical protein
MNASVKDIHRSSTLETPIKDPDSSKPNAFALDTSSKNLIGIRLKEMFRL